MFLRSEKDCHLAHEIVFLFGPQISSESTNVEVISIEYDCLYQFVWILIVEVKIDAFFFMRPNHNDLILSSDQTKLDSTSYYQALYFFDQHWPFIPDI